MASVLVIDLYVYLQQKITKLLEIEGHDVIGIYPGRDLLGVNLRRRQFDYILVNQGVSPRFQKQLKESVDKYQQECQIMGAVYDRDYLLQMVSR